MTAANGADVPPDFVLLVEDDPGDETLMRMAFKRRRLPDPLVVVHDGVEAVEFLLGPGGVPGASGRARPRSVILDWKMPRLGGLGVLERVRAHPWTRHVPITVFTSSDDPGDIQAAYSAGANSYVKKPVKAEEMAEAVRTICAYWLNLNIAPRPAPGLDGGGRMSGGGVADGA